MRHARLPALVLMVLCLVATRAAAEDFATASLSNWHQWRGPVANGTSPTANPPLTWDDTKNIRWKADLPGEGSSTPIIWGDNVFLQTAIETDRTVELPPEPEKKDEKAPPPGAPPCRASRRGRIMFTSSW